MKRRHLLGLSALGLLGGWALRPGDHGREHDAYFAVLNRHLQRDGEGVPTLLLDLDPVSYTHLDVYKRQVTAAVYRGFDQELRLR